MFGLGNQFVTNSQRLEKAAPRQRRQAPVTVDEANSVMSAAWRDRSLYGHRDTGIIGLLFGTGVGERQLRELTLKDYCRIGGQVQFCAGEGQIVRLNGAASLIIERWIAVRGGAEGHLFNPIIRPGGVLRRGLNGSAVNDILARRAQEAGVKPFSRSDIVGTQNLVSRGMWDCSRYALRGICLFQLAPNPAAAGSEPGVHFLPSGSPLAGSSDSARMLLRHLAQHAAPRRAAVRRRLDILAGYLSGGRCNAMEFDWCDVFGRELPPMRAFVEQHGVREVNAIRKAFCGLVRTGVALAVVDSAAHTAVCDDFGRST
jgi:hypothetical protein